jgi:hypothetical protein
MAFVKEKRQVGVTAAKIGVTRGGGAKAVASAISSSSIVDAVQTYNNYYQDIKIKKEKALGKQLAENLDIIYEDYTDENGVTTKIAAGYKRPDDQLKTNWATTEFDEEVVGNYVDATAENAKTIIANIKADMKSKININNTTGQVAQGFDVAMEEPLQAIIENLPEGLEDTFRSKINASLISAKNELTNKHTALRETVANAKMTRQTKEFLDRAVTGSIINPEQTAIELDELIAEANIQVAKGNPAAADTLSRVPAIQASLKLGKSLSPYVTKDMMSSSGLAATAKNLEQINMMLLQGPGATVTVTDLTTGKPKEINFKSLGIKEDEWPNLRGEMQIRSQKLLNMIKNKSTASAKSADIINKYNRSSAENISYFNDTSSKKDLAAILDNVDAPGMETLIGDFVANNPGVNLTTQNFNDPNSRKEKHLFYTYIASKTGVVPESMRQKITATLSSSGIRNKANLLAFVGSPEFAVFTGAPSKITGKTGNTIQVADIFSSTGLDEDTENAALMLRRLTGFYGQEEGVNMFMQQMEEKANATVNRTLKDVAIDKGYKSAEKLSNKIIEKIVGYYDNWGEDDIVGHNFISQVKQDVERKLMFDKEADIDDTVKHALNKIDRQGNFGFSNFSIPLGTLTTADDGVDLSDTGRIYTRFPPDDLLDEKGMEYIDNLLEQRHPDLVAKWGSDLVLGENVFLQVIGQPANEAQVAYRVVFADRTGSSQNILVNKDYNILTVSRQDLKTLDR